MVKNLNWCAIRTMLSQTLRFLGKCFVFIATSFFTFTNIIKPLYLWYANKFFFENFPWRYGVNHAEAIIILALALLAGVPCLAGIIHLSYVLKDSILSWYKMEDAICKANRKGKK